MRDYRNEQELTRDLKGGRTEAVADERTVLERSAAALAVAKETVGETLQKGRALADIVKRNKDAPSRERAKESKDEAPLASLGKEDGGATSLNTSLSDASLNGGSLSPGGSRLLGTLRESAQNIAQRTDELKVHAQALRDELMERRHGDAFIGAAGIRFTVAAAWGGAAGWLYMQISETLIANPQAVAIPGGIPLVDAQGLQTLFLRLFLLGVVATTLMILPSFLIGRFSNAGVTRKADNFGAAIAKMLKSIDTDLERQRDILADTGLSESTIQNEVPKAHLKAEEAVLLFEEVGFLIEPSSNADSPSRDTLLQFEDYLRSATVVQQRTAAASSMFSGLLGIMIGVVLGFIATSIGIFGVAPQDALAQLDPPPGIGLYPLYALLAMGGAFAFFIAGPVSQTMMHGLGRDLRLERMRGALDTVRGAITSAEAPRARDIAQHVEALSEIFRVRLSKGAADKKQASDNEQPTWRQAPDEKPRFVETGFVSTPKSFLADHPQEIPADLEKQSPLRRFAPGLFKNSGDAPRRNER